MKYKFLVFGEDHNDQVAICTLIQALKRRDADVKAEPRKRPLVLARGAAPKKRRTMADDIASFVSMASGPGIKVIAVAHRDCDSVEPAHEREIQSLRDDLAAVGVKDALIAAPSWEIEAWWMLFPNALAATRGCWSAVDYAGQSVGQIENAKERLRRDLRPKDTRQRAKCPDYTESDSPTIARKIAENPKNLISIKAKSDSFSSFKNALDGIFDDKPTSGRRISVRLLGA